MEALDSSHDYVFAAKLSYSDVSLQLINGVLYLQFILFTFSSIFKMIKLQIPFDSTKIYS